MMNILFVTLQVAKSLRLEITLITQKQVSMIADHVGLQRLCRRCIIFTLITGKIRLVSRQLVNRQLVAPQI